MRKNHSWTKTAILRVINGYIRRDFLLRRSYQDSRLLPMNCCTEGHHFIVSIHLSVVLFYEHYNHAVHYLFNALSGYQQTDNRIVRSPCSPFIDKFVRKMFGRGVQKYRYSNMPANPHSMPHICSWAVGGDRKNDIADDGSQNDFPLQVGFHIGWRELASGGSWE